MMKSTLYTLNGALLVMVFLIVRVFFVPITVSIYAAQYHNWNLFQALGTMKPICHLCNFLQFSFQFYWFVLLVRLTGAVVRSWSNYGEEPKNRSRHNRITERAHDYKQE